MKNLYRFLAALMCLCFVSIIGALVLNKTIDKAVKTADVKFEKFTAEYSAKLKDAKVSHNLYFINCFPNVCAKVSFGRYEKTSKVITAGVTKDGQVSEEKETIKKDRYDLGVTDFIIAKYSPITDKITLDLNANNVIFLKNNEKQGSAYFEKLSYSASANTVDSYLESLIGESVKESKNLKADYELNIKNPRAAYQDLRVKAAALELSAKSFDITEKTVSSNAKLNLQALSINNSDKKANTIYDIEIENMDKKFVLSLLEINNIKIDPDAKKFDQETIQEALKIAANLIESIKKFNENKTLIKFKDASLKIYDEKTAKTMADYKGSAELTLDKNQDLVGFIKLNVLAVDEHNQNVIKDLKLADRKEGKTYKLFKEVEEGKFISDIKFENGKAIVNSKEIEVKGQVKALLDFASGMVNLFAMQSAMK